LGVEIGYRKLGGVDGGHQVHGAASSRCSRERQASRRAPYATKGSGAGSGAQNRLSSSDHGDAIDMEPTSRFVKEGKETLYPLRKPFARHWFHQEPFAGRVRWKPLSFS